MQEFIAAYTSGLVGCDTDHPPEAMALSHAFAALGESYFPVETSFSLEDWCASLLCVQLRSAPSVGDCSAKQLPQPDGTGWVARTHDHQQGQMLTRVSLVLAALTGCAAASYGVMSMTRSNAAPAQRVPSTAGDEAAECVQLHRINLWCSARIWRADVHFLFRVATSSWGSVTEDHKFPSQGLEWKKAAKTLPNPIKDPEGKFNV
eukprot:370710-Rhodomonas_salina.2